MAALLPTLFIPISVDGYVLPRASVALAGGGLLLGAGLVAGRQSLGALRLPALAVALAAAAAGLLSTAPAVTLVGAYGRYESLPVRLAYLALFCGAAWLGERRRTFDGYLLGCGVAAVETLYQAVTQTLPRPDGNLGNANLLGVLLAMALPLTAERALGAAPPQRRAWIALGALLGAGLAASTSRSAWLGALLGVTVLVAFLVPRRRLWMPLAAGGLALGVAAALIALTPLRALNDDTGEARLGVWRDSLAVIGERPVLGWGEDTTGLVFGRHQTRDWGPGHNFDRAHSMPLDLATTQGAAGVAACTWLLLTWWLGAWRRRQAPGTAGLAGAAAAYLAWSLVNFDWAPATAAFWLLAGAGWSSPSPSKASPSPSTGEGRGGGVERSAPAVSASGLDACPAAPPLPGPPPPLVRPRAHEGGRVCRARWPGAACAVSLSLGLAVPPLVADISYYLGRVEANAGRPAAAAAAYRRAAAVDPLQPAYQAARADLAGLRRAAQLGDPSPTTYVALGDAEARAGRRAAASAAYRRALELYPFDAEARQRLDAMRARPIASRRAASG